MKNYEYFYPGEISEEMIVPFSDMALCTPPREKRRRESPPLYTVPFIDAENEKFFYGEER